MKPSTISQISLEGEDQLLSLIHRLNNLSPGLEDNIEFEELSNSSKKNIARTLIRNDRRISNQEKQEKFLLKQSEKEAKAEQYNRHMNSFDLSETNFNLKLDFQSKTLVESDVLTIPSENLLTLRDEQSFNLPETRNSLDSSDVIPIGLPILHQPVKEELLKTIDQNSVVVIVGETGCGKSTQVPQIILDSLPMSNIVCTQPRRIAAISIAERVSTEMGQPCGDLVGYHVRLQSSYGQQTRILYCTTGILLKKLQDPSYLQTISHVIIDEVHERQVETDFLMAILNRLRTDRPNLKLILMSATVHSELIQSYFSPCPVVQVPGRMFHVSEFYLEDINALVRTGQLIQSGMVASHPNDIPEDDGPSTSRPENQKNFHRVAEDQIAEFVIRLIQRENALKQRTLQEDDRGEAVLIFLPGIQSIEKLNKILRSRQTQSLLNASIYILHSSLAPAQQRRVFSPTRPGEWKIVLSTNIAESSVTIDDITHVIDTGLVREMRFDPVGQLSSLSTINCSRASLTQRKGRAGRVKSGTCWRFFSRDWMTNAQLEDYSVPEMRRVPLEDVCLQCLFLGLGNPEEFLATCIEPPSREQVKDAISLLLEIGAIQIPEVSTESKYEMTPLGLHLVRLPLDVKLGKMLIYACLFNCIDPILTVAAALGGKSPLLHPLDNRDAAVAAHARFSTRNHPSFTVPIPESPFQLSKKPYFPYSDHLTVIRVFDQWNHLRVSEGRDAAFEFCRNNFLSCAALEDILDIRMQFRLYLEQSNLLAVLPKDQDSPRTFSEDLVRCALCAGLFPRVARVCMVQKFANKKGKKPKYTQKILDKFDEEVMIHQSSILFRHTRSLLGRNLEDESRKELFLAYHKKIASPLPSLYDASSVSPVALMLFGQSFSEATKGSHRTRVIVNGWIHLEIPELHAAIIRRLRWEIDNLLLSKVTESKLDMMDLKKLELVNSILTRILSHDLCD